MGSSLDEALQQDSPAQEEGFTLATEHDMARVYEVDPLRDPRWQNLSRCLRFPLRGLAGRASPHLRI